MEGSLYMLVSEVMKKYITNILIFFIVVSTIDICVGYAGDYLQSHAKGGSTKEFDDLVTKDKHDVLILGSSRAHHHYDAPYMSKLLGLDVYNAGYDGNGIVLSYGILSMIVERYKPKLVIFDVEPAFDIYEYKEDNNNKRYIHYLKPYFRTSEVGDIIREVSLEEWYKVHSGMIRYNTSIVQMILDNLRECSTKNKGYAPLYGKYTKEPEKKVEGAKFLLDSFKLECVEKLIELAKDNNIPIIVMVSPHYGSEDSKDLRPVFDICEKNQVPFIDYYADEEFMQHKDWFKEPMHLNDDGAKVYTSIVSKKIKECIEYIFSYNMIGGGK